MQHTLIAVFDRHAEAQSARDALLAAGFAGAELRHQVPVAGTAEGGGQEEAPRGEHESGHEGKHGIGAGIRHFFADLRGDDGARAARHDAARAGGKYVLTLVAVNEPDIARAADIIGRHGPVAIDEEMGGRFLAGDYRAHFASVYGSGDGGMDRGGRAYDDYLPAYRYGAEVAVIEQYRGRGWDDVELALRREWETRHPESAWEQFKAAVRHGWERIRS